MKTLTRKEDNEEQVCGGKILRLHAWMLLWLVSIYQEFDGFRQPSYHHLYLRSSFYQVEVIRSLVTSGSVRWSTLVECISITSIL